AAAAAMAAADARVAQVVVCTPDKDLAQCVRGDRVVQLDRRTRELRDESAVRQKFGVPPTSIPDWLALVGDSADGYPGLPGWGEKSAATVLARYRHLEHIPKVAAEWDVPVRGAKRLATTLTGGTSSSSIPNTADNRSAAMRLPTARRARDTVAVVAELSSSAWSTWRSRKKSSGLASRRMPTP